MQALQLPSAGLHNKCNLDLQDPARFVRSMFGQKVHRTVTVFDKCKTNQKAAKYAAMLPLAAVDPNSANQQVRSPPSASVGCACILLVQCYPNMSVEREC